MQTSIERVQILYEIAMSIGTSLDLRKMLKESLSTFLRKLNCSVGSILLLKAEKNGSYYFYPIYTIPKRAENVKTYQDTLKKTLHTFSESQIRDFNQNLPLQLSFKNDSYSYIFELPGFGLMILIKKGSELESLIVKSLKPLHLKLASACNACLQNEELEKSHRNAVELNLELTQKTEELKKSRMALLNIMKDMKEADEKLQKANENLEIKVKERTTELSKTNERLQEQLIERKILESQLVQAQKLESIGQLAAGIAHEINTPTQYVGDNTHFLQDAFKDLNELLEKYNRLLQSTKKGDVSSILITEIEEFIDEIDLEYLNDEIPESLHQAMDGVTQISNIVKAMKEFSHPGSKEKTAIDINKAIESTITVSRNEWKYVADVVTNFDSTLPYIPCLPSEFNQVILNIIVNAAHAIEDMVGDGENSKGTITISTKNDGKFAEIQISDTGTGIPEEARHKIFDPFFTTKEVGKGTGQGMTIAHSIITEKHGGSITFATEMGKGTTFFIKIPKDDPIE